jgi:hypothetical protein
MEKFQVFIVNDDQSKSLLLECASDEEALSYIDAEQIKDPYKIFSLEFTGESGTCIIF